MLFLPLTQLQLLLLCLLKPTIWIGFPLSLLPVSDEDEDVDVDGGVVLELELELEEKDVDGFELGVATIVCKQH